MGSTASSCKGPSSHQPWLFKDMVLDAWMEPVEPHQIFD
jgi:hypothetical protein